MCPVYSVTRVPGLDTLMLFLVLVLPLFLVLMSRLRSERYR